MKYLLILIVITFSSCATISHKKTYILEIKSDIVSKVKVYDSIYDLPVNIIVKRSSEKLKLTHIFDSIKKEHNLNWKLNPSYIYGNVFSYFFTGYLIDLTNPRRFYYGKTIILNKNDSIKIIKTPIFNPVLEYGNQFVNHFTKAYPTKKGKFDITFSIPIASNFEMRPLNERIKKSFGFGISIGADYYYKKNKFVSLNLTAFADKFAPDGYFDDGAYERERIYSSNISLSDNFKINRFSLGYGLNFAKNTWEFSKLEEFETFNKSLYKSKTSYNLGLIFNGYYQIFEYFYVGLNYRPTVFQTYPTTIFKYNHVFGMDFQYRL